MAYTHNENIVFVDTETTGLSPEIHTVWEVGLITPSGEETVYATYPDAEFMAMADPNALRLTNFYTRWRDPGAGRGRGARGWKGYEIWDAKYVAGRVAEITAGKHIAGAVVSFDAIMLERLLRRHGYAPAWHYHLIDVEAFAAGRLGLEPPWDSADLARQLGVEEWPVKHTALGDARQAQQLYLAALSKPKENA